MENKQNTSKEALGSTHTFIGENLAGRNVYSGISTRITDESPWNNSTSTMTISRYSCVKLIDTLIFEDRIELVYRGILSSTALPIQQHIHNFEIWKNVYGCINGKFAMIEHVFGEYVPAQEETYKF